MAITYAKLVSGNPLMVDHTPGSDVSAGDVVVVGDETMVAHLDIASGRPGSLSPVGGVYEMPKAAGGSTAIAAGKRVYWDATNHVVTVTSTDNKKFGVTVKASVDADTSVHVLKTTTD